MTTATYTPRLKEIYVSTLRSQLKADLELGNIMEVPRLAKIVVNVGCGAALDHRRE